VKEYGRSLQEKWGEDKIWVWDSEGYSEKNLREISESYKWIMRVPETLSEAKEVLENADTEKMKSTSLNGYRLFSIEVEYGGVKQRETKTLEKKIKKEKEQVGKEVWHLSNQEFYSEEDVLKAAREKENGGRERPRKDEPTQTVYRVKAEFAEDKSVIEKEMLKKGKFIVASPVRA